MGKVHADHADFKKNTTEAKRKIARERKPEGGKASPSEAEQAFTTDAHRLKKDEHRCKKDNYGAPAEEEASKDGKK